MASPRAARGGKSSSRPPVLSWRPAGMDIPVPWFPAPPLPPIPPPMLFGEGLRVGLALQIQTSLKLKIPIPGQMVSPGDPFRSWSTNKQEMPNKSVGWFGLAKTEPSTQIPGQGPGLTPRHPQKSWAAFAYGELQTKGGFSRTSFAISLHVSATLLSRYTKRSPLRGFSPPGQRVQVWAEAIAMKVIRRSRARRSVMMVWFEGNNKQQMLIYGRIVTVYFVIVCSLFTIWISLTRKNVLSS